MDVPVSIIAKAIVAAKWGDEADILIIANGLGWQTRTLRCRANVHYPASRSRVLRRSALPMTDTDDRLIASAAIIGLRSEEHTSELQSLMRISYAVFCLKKKENNNTNERTQTQDH